jgi:ABC-2 type transport system permease protein
MINRIRTIIDKEWAEVFKNRIVLFTVIIMPLIFTVLPLVILYTTRSTGGNSSTADVPAVFAQACGSVSGMDCLQIYMVNEFLILFMIMPVAIPVAIAAYSIVGEKTTRSLEPLLATPITTEELLAGKSLAAAVPAILATWGCFALFLLLSPLTGISQAVLHYLLGPTWLLAVILLGPLMAIMAVNFAVIVSSRVNDPRAAEQISMVVIVPVLGVMFAQLGGLLVVNVPLVLISAVLLAAVDAVLIYFGARMFQRETILTKWR